MTIASRLGSRTRHAGLRPRLVLLAPAMLAGLILAGCETIPPPPPPPPPAPVGPAQFNAADFAWSTQKGDNAIVGTVAYRGRGLVWACAGNIGLTPQTRYSRDRMVRLYGSDVEAVQPTAAVRSRTVAAPAPPEYAQFVQSEKCDAQNGFVFRNLPDGAYFVIAPLHSAQAGGEDVVVMDRVEVYRGMMLRLTLPRAAASPAGAVAPRRP